MKLSSARCSIAPAPFKHEEARPGQRRASVQVEDAEPLGQVPVRQRLEVERPRLAPLAHELVLRVVLAGRHARVGQVGHPGQRRRRARLSPAAAPLRARPADRRARAARPVCASDGAPREPLLRCLRSARSASTSVGQPPPLFVGGDGRVERPHGVFVAPGQDCPRPSGRVAVAQDSACDQSCSNSGRLVGRVERLPPAIGPDGPRLLATNYCWWTAGAAAERGSRREWCADRSAA